MSIRRREEALSKTFIGPHLRKLRLDRKETQAQMAKALGISTSYVNLLEKNERSVSVPVMLKLFDAYGVDWREIADDEDATILSDLRALVQEPLFEGARPDLTQLRAALVHSPDLVQCVLRLHRANQAATDQLLSLAEARDAAAPAIVSTSPEAIVHTYFRSNRNHFPRLERAAEAFWDDGPVATDEIYVRVKERLQRRHGLSVRVVPVSDLPYTLRDYDEQRREVRLSEALDYTNRVFQLVHVAGLLEQEDVLNQQLDRSGITDARGAARCRVELANYFAAAVLMPYGSFVKNAQDCKYDMDHLATRFGVSFEQACHRATTLQQTGAQGVPFFFLRIDKAGNVTKRFNSTDFPLAEHGGACPRLDVHTSFRVPGRIVTQFVETPDAAKFFVFSRTVDRPKFTRHNQDVRLAVALGCAVEHVADIGYAENFALGGIQPDQIGINCRVCPRANCDQRAHHAVVMSEPVDANRRGATRYES
ncbi:MAG: short-chain fatty acyl-CoA regulator family protein [Pseudomonadota bacterium]